MTNHPIPAISNPEVTTTLRYSGDVIIAIRDLLTDVNLTPLYENWRPLINTQFLFRSGKLAFSDPDQTNEVVFIIDDIIDHDGNVNLHIPAFTDADDTILLENHPATFANKVIGANVQVSAGLPFNNTAITAAIIDASLNTLSNISQTSLLQITDKAKLPNPTVYTDQNNTFGSGYSQTFQSGYLKLYNPAATFTYNLVAAAISANRNITIPLLTADDTLTFAGITNVFTTWQKIQYGSADSLVLYRPTNTAANTTGIAFNLQTSTNAESTYAKIYGIINTNTNGSEDGGIQVVTKKAGTLAERFIVNQDGQFGGTNSSGFRALIDPVNSTANRFYTLPDSSGTLALRDVQNTFLAKQQINQTGASDHLILYRGESTVGNTHGINFKANNASSGVVTYATMLGAIGSNASDNTAGAENGQFFLQLMDAGTLKTKIQVTKNGLFTTDLVPKFTVGSGDFNSFYIYRPNNANASCLINFNLQNASSAEKTFGYVGARSETLTAGLEVGSLQFGTIESGTVSLQAKIQSGTLYLGTGLVNTASISNSGLSSSRSFTFPDLSGQVVTTNAAQTLTGPKTLTSPIINTPVMSTTITTTGTPLILSRTAAAGTAEPLFKMVISDDNTSYIQFDNATTGANLFYPRLTSYNADTNLAAVGMYQYYNIAATADTADHVNAVAIFDVRRSDSTSIQYKRLYQFRNAGTNIFEIYTNKFDFTSKKLVNAVFNIDESTLKHSTTNAAGDILYYDSTAARYTRLPLGSDGTFLKVVSGSLAWTANTVFVSNLDDIGNVATSGAVNTNILMFDGTNWVPAGIGTNGEANTAANVGTGTGLIFRDKTATTLNLKSLIAGTGISITNGADAITLALNGNYLTDTNTVTVTNKTLDAISNILKNIGQYKWQVFTISGTTYARNTSTGAIDSQNVDPTVVIQYCIDNAGGSAFLVKAGTYLLTQKLNAIDKSFIIIGEGAKLSGNAGSTGDTILKANYTGSAGTAFIDCNNTVYTRQYFWNVVIDCNDTVPYGVLAYDVRERYPWFYNSAVLNASDIGIKGSKIVYTSTWNLVIAGCTNIGLQLYDAGAGVMPNTFYMYSGRITGNGINVQIDSCTDVGFSQVVLEAGVTNCIKITSSNAKQIRFRDCSFEWHPITTTNIACDITGNNVIFDACRFDSNNTTYYPITVRATAKSIKFDKCMFQANQANTTANITIESGATNVSFMDCMKDTNQSNLTVSVTDNANSTFLGNSFIQDKVSNGLQLGTNKLWIKEVDANTFGFYASDGTTQKNILATGMNVFVIRNTGFTDMITFNAGPTISFNSRAISNFIFTTDSNTLKHSTTNAAGDILKSNGTKFDRYALGSANQLLAVNSGATDAVWTTLTSTHLPSTTAYTNANNSFSAAQTISINTEGILDLYLPINTAASLWGIHFNAKDSGSTKTAFAKILASLDDNTDTSEDGSLGFYYQVAGTLARRGWFASNGMGFGASGASGFLSSSGLTGNRTYTFPDTDSKLFGDGIDNALGAHYVDITKIGSDPTNPATDHSYIYSRNTDGHVVIKKSSGSVVDLESSAITNLDSLTDVAVSSPSTGQILKYNGTNFVNKFPSFIGYGNVIDPNATTPVIFGEVKSIAKTSTGATVSDQFDSTYGSFKRFSLSAANGNYYFWKGGNKIAYSTVFTYWKFVFRLNNTSNFRFDIGLFDIAQTYPANSDTAAFPSFPFFGAVKNTTSASLKCCHNDASGNEVYEGTAIQATSDTNWHTIEFYVNRTGDNAFEYSFDGGSLVKVTTDIPATTVGLVPFFGGFTPASGATAISFDLKIFEFAIPLI